MFRFEVFVDDKKLPYVLWALSGHCISVSTPQPVVNAKKGANGKIHSVTAGGTLLELFAEHLKQTKPESIKVSDVREFLESNGTAPANAGYVLKQAVLAKLIKKDRKSPAQGIACKYVVLAPNVRA